MTFKFQPAEGCWGGASTKNIAFRAWWWAQGVCSAGDLLLWGDRKWPWVLHDTGASVACAAPASDSTCWSWGPGGRGEAHWGTGYRLVSAEFLEVKIQYIMLWCNMWNVKQTLICQLMSWVYFQCCSCGVYSLAVLEVWLCWGNVYILHALRNFIASAWSILNSYLLLHILSFLLSSFFSCICSLFKE